VIGAKFLALVLLAPAPARVGPARVREVISRVEARAAAKTRAASGGPGRVGGALVPASAQGALLLEGEGGAAGLRELLAAASRFAPALRPEEVSLELSQRVAVDVFSPGAGAKAGLAGAGPRALVFSGSAEGLSAPVANAALAGRALIAWLREAGKPGRTRRGRLEGPLVSGQGAQSRAGMIATVAGSRRLLAASGPGAAALVSAMARVGARRSDTPPVARDGAVRAALEAATGPAILWLRGTDPVLAVVLSLHGAAQGLDAAGVLLSSSKDPILAGPAPAPECAGAIFCASANLGPAALPLLASAARELVLRAVPASGREPFDALLQRAVRTAQGPAALRIDALDATALTSTREIPKAVSFLARASAQGLSLAVPPPVPASIEVAEDGVALRSSPPLCLRMRDGLVWLGTPCPPSAPAQLPPGAAGGPSLDARLDTRAVASALSRLSPFDALRGDAAAGAYGVRLLVGTLLAQSGPATLTARPDAVQPRNLLLDLHWPLHGRAHPQ
jgi:hypothetical protein